MRKNSRTKKSVKRAYLEKGLKRDLKKISQMAAGIVNSLIRGIYAIGSFFTQKILKPAASNPLQLLISLFLVVRVEQLHSKLDHVFHAIGNMVGTVLVNFIMMTSAISDMMDNLFKLFNA